MKIDSLFKAMLVGIALLFTSSCTQDLSTFSEKPEHPKDSSGHKNPANPSTDSKPSIFENRAEAAPPPAFLQRGQHYSIAFPVSDPRLLSDPRFSSVRDVTILDIDDSGWLQVQPARTDEQGNIISEAQDSSFWININMATTIVKLVP